MSITDEIRSACRGIAERSRHVRINRDRIGGYTRRLPAAPPVAPARAPEGRLEEAAAHWLQLNAINFGSGWFPTLRKRPGVSGFRTVQAGLKARGPWPAEALAAVRADEIAAVLGQDPGHELMELYARHLRELGASVLSVHDGSFLALARSGDGSAVALAERLATMPSFADVSVYGEQRIPFYKRAQITASDLHLAGIAPAHDLERLTLFADNLVPHVLRLDGVLAFDDGLVARIEDELLIDHGSPEEVEIRACALHAVELLVAAHGATTAATVDNVLWDRGAGARYKAVPRHRARCTAY